MALCLVQLRQFSVMGETLRLAPYIGQIRVAEAIEYLVRAEWVTGVALEVDGGLGLGVSSF